MGEQLTRRGAGARHPVIRLDRPVPGYGRVPSLSPDLDILGSGWICRVHEPDLSFILTPTRMTASSSISTGTFFAPGEMESGYIGGLKLPDWNPRIEVKSKNSDDRG